MGPFQKSPEQIRLVVWAIVPLAIFSVSVGKQPRYILPCLVPLAILLASTIASRVRATSNGRRDPALCTVGVIAGAVLLVVGVLLYRAAPLVTAAGGGGGIGGWSILVVTSALAVIAAAGQRSARLLPATLAVAAALTLLSVHGAILAMRSPDPVVRAAQTLTAAAAPNTPFCACGAFLRNLPFYVRSRIVRAGTQEEVNAALSGAGPVLAAIDARKLAEAETALNRRFERLIEIPVLEYGAPPNRRFSVPRPRTRAPASRHHQDAMSGRVVTHLPAAVAFVAVAFFLRLAFGLAYEFWADDELQVFLIGLSHYTTGEWPYFGPDVVYSRTRIPGGLVGLLISTPLRLLAVPEAPYVLLNLLSCAALALLAWYVGRRNPSVPRWFLWPWVFFAPWTLNFSTHVVNPSYVLIGAIVFFVGAFELLPGVSLRVMPNRIAFACMGFGLLWVYQLHLSFPLMLPFVAVAFLATARRDTREAASGAAWFVAGAAIPALALLPTLVRFGLTSSVATAGANVVIDVTNVVRIPEITARFLSFASFEVPRFLGNNTASRLEFLWRHPWSAPVVVFAGVVGLLQPFVLLLAFFTTRHDRPEWHGVKWTALLTILLVCASFLFSVKDPASHAFYVTFPVATIYAFYCWEILLQRQWVRVIAASLLVCTAVIHLAIAIDHGKTRSLYTNRELVVRAIREKNYRLLGERRPVTWEANPDTR